jgi:hypothetical protein
MRRAIVSLLAAFVAVPALAGTCEATSRAQLTPVVELYTSEGCSSCPPADRWLSGLKQAAADGRVVAQAFHVGYWDQLGWADRFALAAGTQRQKQLAAINHLSTIYTPQVVRDGLDSSADASALQGRGEPAQARVHLEQGQPGGLVDASVEPVDPARRWAAYWTLTESGHSSKVKAGENAGEFLKHDFVVRQYVTTATFTGPQKLSLRLLPREGTAPRIVNLVVVDPATQRPLQAVSLSCVG